MSVNPYALRLLTGFVFLPITLASAAVVEETADILVVGGTESGCAAAVQAARMGAQRVVMVNDIEWLGGQFSAEGLGAIDENRAGNYNGTVPFPRSGVFQEIYNRIRTLNLAKFNGVADPGNTLVNITALPVDSEQVFRDLLAPYEESSKIVRYSNLAPVSVTKNADGTKLTGVVFESTSGSGDTLSVTASVTIDASDWGEVVKLSGAAYEFGPDPKSKYGEALASTSALPVTDMNPITYCMILEQQAEEALIAKPQGYLARDFTVGNWNYIRAEFAYTSRRLVDSVGYPQITSSKDVVLINDPHIDYPLDTLPPSVVTALEANETGSSTKNIVEMTRAQRQIIFDDAKLRTLRYFYFLQQVTSTSTYNFRKMALSDMFGTADKLPIKPYIRESLRLKADYMTRQQDTASHIGERNYARVIFHDTIACFEFEYDFHPTARSFHTGPSDGTWHATFRGKRGFANGGSGRATFPLRSLVPESIDGLVVAQKNLGYSSIVSSALRLHDQSIAIGQAAAAAAVVAKNHAVEVREIPWSSSLMSEVWNGLLVPGDGAPPLILWPFSDVDTFHTAFVAINQLAVRKLLGTAPAELDFQADSAPSQAWLDSLLTIARERGYSPPTEIFDTIPSTRGGAAIKLWDALSTQPEPAWTRLSPGDADLDSIPDSNDPLPFSSDPTSWSLSPATDGLPDLASLSASVWTGINYTTTTGTAVTNFFEDTGQTYNSTRRYGWLVDLTANTRRRNIYAEPLRDTFVFTRQQDTWQADVANGWYRVWLSVGDSGSDQGPQSVSVEGQVVISAVNTTTGSYKETNRIVKVEDGKLTVIIGKANTANPPQNTTLNWLIYADLSRSDTDLDSINDAWELNYTGDLSSLGGGDFDQDGSKDSSEYGFRTDPTDPNDQLTLRLTQLDEAKIWLEWFGRAGVDYKVGWAPDLEGTWSRLPATYTGMDENIVVEIPRDTLVPVSEGKGFFILTAPY